MAQEQGAGEAFRRVGPQEAKAMMDTGKATVVDVREDWEFARDHIPNAAHTPLARILSRPRESILADDLIFVCEVGQRSAVAAEMASALGKQNVYNLEGGMTAWRREQLPIAK
jgi:rhodanese-related sulfurtransferase